MTEEFNFETKGFWYVATPYDKYAEGREKAWIHACAVAGLLMERGHTVYCPIAHGHAIKKHTSAKLPQTHEFWLAQDKAFTDAAVGLFVVKMPGWEESMGVQWEIKEFTKAGKPIIYLEWS